MYLEVLGLWKEVRGIPTSAQPKIFNKSSVKVFQIPQLQISFLWQYPPKVSVKVFGPFSNFFLILFYYWVLNDLLIFEITVLYQIYLLQNFAFIFAPSVWPVDLDKLKSWGSVSSSAAQGNLTHSVYVSRSYCCSLVTESCPILCDPVDCSTSSSPVLHYLPEFAQLHTHWFGDASCVWLATRWSPMALTFSYPHLCAFPLFSVLAAVTDLLLMNGKLAMSEWKTYHFHAWVISRTWLPSQVLPLISSGSFPSERSQLLWRGSPVDKELGVTSSRAFNPGVGSSELNPEMLQALPTPDCGLLTGPMS